MFTNNLVRRSAPATDGLVTFADRFFHSDPFFSFRLPAVWSEPRSANSEGWSPSVDVHEESDAYVFSADLPGLAKSDVDVSVEDNVLTLAGQRTFQEVERDSYRRLERSYGKFSRHFSLPSHVDAGKVEASFKNGVLKIRVPKSETAKSRKIKIQ